ncbi:MAG: aldehyde dehydrogenase family protein [Myxococcales bacterium]|nr:aldehyde dehydrogenase family protein [Myxococcales bacterium]MBL0197371.1 aldehyde dehydrogenase family protein [Myxococcales bacterium]
MSDDSPFSSVSPVDGEPLAEVVATPLDTLEALVAKARGAQVAWADRDVDDRRKALAKLGPRVLQAADELATLVHRETGKPEVEVLLGEVLASADVVAYWCAASEELFEPEEVELDALSYPKKYGFIHRVARGVVAIVMPWNFPFALPLRAIVPALLAGNAVVFKPSEVTPRTGEKIRALLEGLVPEGVFQVVQGGRDLGAALVGADVDAVVFTGSAAAGRKVAASCAERLVPCALELGGKDAAIVLEDANLERAANGLVWGAMMNAGQNCGAVERVYVVEKVAAALKEKIVAVAKSLEAGRDYGPLTTETQRAIVRRHLASAKAGGAKLLAGSFGDEGEGGGVAEAAKGAAPIAPTVLEVTTDELDVMCEETFGPVLPIRVVKDAEEALTLANASKYGLTASVWTKDVERGEKLARRLRAGVVTVNNHSFTGAIPQAPWTGVGESGYGVTGSHFALDIFTRPKFVLVDENSAARELYWYPYTPALRAVATALVLVRGGARSIGARIGAIFALLKSLPKRLFGG